MLGSAGGAATVILGLLFTLGATFVSMALLVRTGFGRGPHAITLLPAPLVLYCLWVSAWFVFEFLRQFLLTAITPATALRLVAFVFLAAALLSGRLPLRVRLRGAPVSRRNGRAAGSRASRECVAPTFSALLIVGLERVSLQRRRRPVHARCAAFWATRRFRSRSAAWVWLLMGARGIPDAPWRARVDHAGARLRGVVLGRGARRRPCGTGWRRSTPALPLAVDVFLVLAYTLITVLWVESVEKAARRAAGAVA